MIGTMDFCPTLRGMYETRETQGRSGKVFRDLGALSTVKNILYIRALMLEFNPQRTLEVGMSYGGSCLAFAATHKDLGHSPVNQHVAIDPAQSTHWDDAGRVALERAGLSGYVGVIDEYSSQALPRLVAEGRKFDMAYIDGSHQFEDVLLDFIYTHEMLSVGGLILFDDSADSHVTKVIRFIQANYDEVYEPVSLSRFQSGLLSKAKSKVATSLHKNQLTVFRKRKDGRQNWGRPLRRF